MRQSLALAAPSRRKKSTRLIGLLLVPFLLVAALGMSLAGGGAANAAAACQVIDNGTAVGTTGGAPVAGALTPLKVEQYWVNAGGPLDAAVTAAAIAYAESDDIPSRLQGSSPSTPSTPGPGTPSDPTQVGWGLWQITPGSAADYDPNVNATIAVEKYRGNLAAGGNGWGPWTTYTSGAYTAGLPAAQAAYAQLTPQGGSGVAPAAVGLTNPLTPHAIATAPTGGASPPASSPQIDTSSADRYITRLAGQNDAQYAIVTANGKVLAQHEDGTQAPVGEVTDAMLVVAYLRAHGSTVPTGAAASHLQAMVNNGDDSAAAWVYRQVGAAAVQHVASLAHMTGFHLDTSPDGHPLARSTATTKDLALLFATVDSLMPSAVHSYGMQLLGGTSDINQWGIADAGISNVAASAGGAVSLSDTDWTLSQAAQVNTSQNGVVGIAITTTQNQSRSNAENVIQNVASDLLANASADSSAFGIDTSSLTPDQQAELKSMAANMQSSGASSQCPNVSVSRTLPTVPGQIATIEGATGLAAAPTGLPASVAPVIDKLIAAGNEIHTLPYIWGGGHSAPLSEMQAGYDCSGSTSFILYKAGLLGPSAMVSGDYEHWGDPGPGKYVTIFSNATHVFIEVDGIVLDTAWYATVAPTSPGSGPRWQPSSMIQAQTNGDVAGGHGGFVLTHPAGL